ncbi:MAG TPA: thioredoxin domain-containing protein [Solirubrobacteraceae bacterium]|jgi:protein-disulfide isomerase|nr:thioredoxin domain-containing protein [Solirubrobacteraceae bacterium]
MSSVEREQEDLTRKQRREQAREQRKAMEQAAAASAARRTRMTQLGVVVTVVVVAIVVILVATSGGGKGGIPASKKAQTSVTKEVAALIGGIPQSGNALGSPKAPVTLQYFGDLECPICREFTLGALPGVISKFVRAGKVRIEYHSMETATREPEVFKSQQVAAYAAGKQSKAWYFIETFYHEQGEEDSGYVTEKYIQGIASQVPGLNLSTWSSDRGDNELSNEVETDKQVANSQGFEGTPSFLIGKTGGGTEKITELSENDLHEASALFDPKIEKLLAS